MQARIMVKAYFRDPEIEYAKQDERRGQDLPPKRPLLLSSLPLQILLAVTFATLVLVFQPDMREEYSKDGYLEIVRHACHVLNALDNHHLSHKHRICIREISRGLTDD